MGPSLGQKSGAGVSGLNLGSKERGPENSRHFECDLARCQHPHRRGRPPVGQTQTASKGQYPLPPFHEASVFPVLFTYPLSPRSCPTTQRSFCSSISISPSSPIGIPLLSSTLRVKLKPHHNSLPLFLFHSILLCSCSLGVISFWNIEVWACLPSVPLCTFCISLLTARCIS
jgi:hypothetical protein